MRSLILPSSKEIHIRALNLNHLIAAETSNWSIRYCHWKHGLWCWSMIATLLYSQPKPWHHHISIILTKKVKIIIANRVFRAVWSLCLYKHSEQNYERHRFTLVFDKRTWGQYEMSNCVLFLIKCLARVVHSRSQSEWDWSRHPRCLQPLCLPRL